ncbi:hypothetical protein SUGI_0750990 [Cryptomeria japonica]|nr:hypothetical protein SUGI_0750990 [Cryptomeria japonica]
MMENADANITPFYNIPKQGFFPPLPTDQNVSNLHIIYSRAKLLYCQQQYISIPAEKTVSPIGKWAPQLNTKAVSSVGSDSQDGSKPEDDANEHTVAGN